MLIRSQLFQLSSTSGFLGITNIHSFSFFMDFSISFRRQVFSKYIKHCKYSFHYKRFHVMTFNTFTVQNYTCIFILFTFLNKSPRKHS